MMLVYNSQSLNKKYGHFWQKNVPGQLIDDHMKVNEMDLAETYKQCIGGKNFLVCYQKDDCYVTKNYEHSWGFEASQQPYTLQQH